jgi:hypothetical protein
MTNEGKTERLFIAACALVAIAFIGGCTAALMGDAESGLMRSCIQASMEWRDGDCVRPEARQ